MASGDDVSDLIALASINQAAVANTSDLIALASINQAAVANASDLIVLASIEQAAVAHGAQVIMLISYTSPQPPPWTLVGYQSGTDAVEDLPNSGASSPFQSNRDAERGIK